MVHHVQALALGLINRVGVSGPTKWLFSCPSFRVWPGWDGEGTKRRQTHRQKVRDLVDRTLCRRSRSTLKAQCVCYMQLNRALWHATEQKGRVWGTVVLGMAVSLSNKRDCSGLHSLPTTVEGRKWLLQLVPWSPLIQHGTHSCLSKQKQHVL